MIELRTGVPGAGKTLSAVQRLSALFQRWNSHPEEARPVFVSGIPDLAFPVSEMPLVSVQINKAGSPSLVPDWDAMPDGSLVIIDEAQGCFPPRSSASQAPAHVAWLNTHRHHGFDIWLTTQHPKLIDASVRALVGKHQHYRRLFGGMRAAVYEWDCCSDSLAGMKTAVISYWSYPKNVFKWYKSAEIHTKQNFKLPRWLLIPVVGVALMVFFFPRAYAVLTNGMSGKSPASSSAPIMSNSQQDIMSQGLPAKQGALAPSVAGIPIDFTKPQTTDAPGDDKKTRSVSELKISHGFYSDNPESEQHFTDDQLAIQAESVRVLAINAAERQYLATLAASQRDVVTPVTANYPISSTRPFSLFY